MKDFYYSYIGFYIAQLTTVDDVVHDIQLYLFLIYSSSERPNLCLIPECMRLF